MSAHGRDVLGEHTYDGIQEFENPTPGWWNWLFFGTFVFSLFYFTFFQFSPVAWTIWDAYDSGVAASLRKRFGSLKMEPDQASLVKYAHDEEWLKVGRIVYTTNCVQCHGADGQGLVGPNLTDEHYKNVKTIADVATVVADGAANGAMPAWKTRLHPNELVLVASYVASIRGKNLNGPRGPEGDVIPPWPPAAESQPADAAAAASPADDPG